MLSFQQLIILKVNLSKISIGTAQFGLNYGITNQRGKVKLKEIEKILQYAQRNNIFKIDTAYAYGNAEKILGNFNLKNWKVSSKFPSIPKQQDAKRWIFSKVYKSLKNLNIKNLETLYVHDTKQLYNQKIIKEISNALEELKRNKVIKKIGVSVYEPKEIYKLNKIINFDIVQAPFNILDKRVSNNKINEFLKKDKIQLELRSIFLQGLLLINENNVPKKFHEWKKFFQKLGEIKKKKNLTMLEIALSALRNIEFKNVVFGVLTQNELREIIKNIPKSKINLPNFNFKNKKKLINPHEW